jgi:hypothetical protein
MDDLHESGAWHWSVTWTNGKGIVGNRLNKKYCIKLCRNQYVRFRLKLRSKYNNNKRPFYRAFIVYCYNALLEVLRDFF